MNKLLTLFATLAATYCAQVHANGVCYDPDHVGVNSKTAETVVADMEAIRQRGFSYVRTYISKFGSVKMAKIIAETGMKAAIGVPFPYHDAAGQAAAAIEAAQNPNVEFIFVGNENLGHAGAVPSEQIALIQSIKSQVPSHVKVGTVQRTTEFLDRASMGGFVDLINACDVVGVNIHPFFNPNTDAVKGVDVLKDQWQRILDSGLPQIRAKLMLTETGWPTDGSILGNQGTIAGAQHYFNAYQSWSSIIPGNKKYYFQMFDQPHRHELYEKTYGLLYPGTYQDKFSAGFDAPVAPSPANPVPAPTEAPATQAPTPSATPSSSPKPTPSAKDEDDKAEESSEGSLSQDVEDSRNSTSGSSHGSFESEMESSSMSGSLSIEETTIEPAVDQASADESEQIERGDGTEQNDTPDQESEKTQDQEGVEASTQSAAGGAGTAIGLVAAAGVCAVLVGAGFIYQARKKARMLYSEDKEEDVTVVTPCGSHTL